MVARGILHDALQGVHSPRRTSIDCDPRLLIAALYRLVICPCSLIRSSMLACPTCLHVSRSAASAANPGKLTAANWTHCMRLPPPGPPTAKRGFRHRRPAARRSAVRRSRPTPRFLVTPPWHATGPQQLRHHTAKAHERAFTGRNARPTPQSTDRHDHDRPQTHRRGPGAQGSQHQLSTQTMISDDRRKQTTRSK